LAFTTQKTAFYLFRAVYVTLGIFGISKSVFDVIWGLRNHFMDGFVKLQVEDCEDNDQKITATTHSLIAACLQSDIPFEIGTLSTLVLNTMNEYQNLELLKAALTTTASLKRVHAQDSCVAFPKIATALGPNKSVTSLDLTRNKEYCSLDTLANILQQNSTLTDLILKECDIGSKGSLKISEAIKTNSSLKRLDLSSNKIEAEGIQGLVDAMKINKSLNHLMIGGNGDNILTDLFDAVKNNDTLTRLDLSATYLSNQECQSLFTALAANKKIRMLELNRCIISHEGWTMVAKLLEMNDTLTDLDLTTSNLKAVDCEKLSQSLALNNTLKILKIGSRNMPISQESMNIDRAIAKALQNNKSLTELYIHKLIMNNSVVDLCEGLKVNKTLTSLYIREIMDLKDFGLEAFTEAQRINPTLKHLDIGSYSIDTRAYAAFREFLYNDFMSLTLRNCVRRHEEVQIIYDRLNVHSTLRSFSLKGCDSLGLESFLLLSAILTSNTVLRSLDVSEIKLEKTFAICRALRHNATLTKLAIDSSARTLDTTQHLRYYQELAAILRKNRSLRILDLTAVHINTTIAAELFECLKFNDFIVDIRSNGDMARIHSPELAERLEENRQDFMKLKEAIRNAITNLYVLARSEKTRNLVSIEIWTFICKHVRFQDVHIDFVPIGQRIWADSFTIRKYVD
jgi:hypothetical protein